MREAKVVTCFLLQPASDGDRILLLRRSERVSTYRGRWAGVSGYLEGEPLAQAYREIAEETGLGPEDVRLLRQGEALEVVDREEDIRWLVYPFLFEVLAPQRLHFDWEHQEARWVSPQALGEFETVPALAEALGRVYPPHR
jgi:ADP-ribose pyrophosphatase YjhB (NUDIX family)